jgi:hypothetical protein
MLDLATILLKVGVYVGKANVIISIGGTLCADASETYKTPIVDIG